MIFQHAYSDSFRGSDLECLDPSLAQQHFKDDADINVMLERFKVTGKTLSLTSGTTTYGLGVNGSSQLIPFTGLVGATLPTGAPTGTNPVSTGIGVVTSGASGLIADLSSATAATINAIRLAFQVQRLLERDARGGTRYTEIVLSHFGVRSPDMRLQRPEYIGGGSTPMVINGVAQTSATGLTASPKPALLPPDFSANCPQNSKPPKSLHHQ